jgi:hypothetical protein
MASAQQYRQAAGREGRTIARSRGLRQALREEAQALGWRPELRRPRVARYDKRRTVAAITRNALNGEPTASRTFPKQEQHVSAPLQQCPSCQRSVPELVWAMSRAGYDAAICPDCAGV